MSGVLCTGWTRKMTDAEKLAAIESIASRALSGVPEPAQPDKDREGQPQQRGGATPDTTDAGEESNAPVAPPGALPGFTDGLARGVSSATPPPEPEKTA